MAMLVAKFFSLTLWLDFNSCSSEHNQKSNHRIKAVKTGKWKKKELRLDSLSYFVIPFYPSKANSHPYSGI